MGLGSAYRAMPLRNQLTLRRCMQDHGLEEAPHLPWAVTSLNHSQQALRSLARW